MPFLVSSGVAWCRHRLEALKNWEAWKERLAGLTVLAGAGVLWWAGPQLSIRVQIILWAAFLLAAAVLFRQSWLKIFGPILFYDLVRNARRRQTVVLRCLYAFAILAVLLGVYTKWCFQLTGDPWRALKAMAIPPAAMPNFIATFFYVFVTLQFLTAFLLTPVYAGGAIADEKEKHTLDFLLATDLNNREIVLSLAVGRLAHLMLIMATGLPILAMLMFLGGLDPGLLLASITAPART